MLEVFSSDHLNVGSKFAITTYPSLALWKILLRKIGFKIIERPKEEKFIVTKILDNTKIEITPLL